MLDAAQWTMRQSHAGFSISLFWPAPSPPKLACRKRRSRRRKQPVQLKELSPGCHSVTSKVPAPVDHPETGPAPTSMENAGTPVNAHQRGLLVDLGNPQVEHVDQQDMQLDLTVCDTVGFEMRDNEPGLAFSKNGSQGWIPVVRRRRYRSPTCSSTRPESSDEEFEVRIQKARQVEYQVRDGIPGLKTRLGPTNRSATWTPVIPSPVSSRTRACKRTGLT